MTTTIFSNGNTDRTLESLPALFRRLRTNILDPTFEAYGNFKSDEDAPAFRDIGQRPVRFFGNFYDYSHVFNISTDDPDLIGLLTEAIRRNQASEAYLAAKREIAEREKLARERREAQDEWKAKEARERALRVLGMGAGR